MTDHLAVASGGESTEQEGAAVERVLAQTWPVGDFLKEEMDARGWASSDVAMRMGWADERALAVNELTVDLILHCGDEPNIVLGTETAYALGRAFGVSPDFWLNLDSLHRNATTAVPGNSVDDATLKSTSAPQTISQTSEQTGGES